MSTTSNGVHAAQHSSNSTFIQLEFIQQGSVPFVGNIVPYALCSVHVCPNRTEKGRALFVKSSGSTQEDAGFFLFTYVSYV